MIIVLTLVPLQNGSKLKAAKKTSAASASLLEVLGRSFQRPEEFDG